MTPRRSYRFALPSAIITSTALALCFLPAQEAKDGGAIQFSEHLIQDGYGYAYGIGAADLDGDGHLDIVSSDTTVNNSLYWFANDGKGTFRRFFIMKNEEGWFERLAIGDINGDGKPDVCVVKNLHGDIVWFANSGKPRDDAVWKRYEVTKGFMRAYDVVLADLAGDGRLDLAASSWSGGQFAWFRNPGKPEEAKQWQKYLIDDKVAETRTIRTGDFNRDGKMDLLGTATAANLVVWYENPGKPGDGSVWKKHIIDDKSPRPTHGHPVDLDGDDDLDVVMALGFNAKPEEKDTHQVVWYENVGKPGDGTVWKKHVIGELPQAFEAIAADINGDGHPDVIATAWGTQATGRVVWFENPGDQQVVPWKMQAVKEKWPRANQVIAADFNGDKRLDIAACAEHGSNELRWWRNEGRQKSSR